MEIPVGKWSVAGSWVWTYCWCWTLKYNFPGTILLSVSDTSGYFIFQVLTIENFTLIIINIYGYNSNHENDIVPETLEKHTQNTLNSFPNSGIVLGGDFNMILDHNIDSWPPRVSSAPNVNLQLFMQKWNLIDVWRFNNPNITYDTVTEAEEHSCFLFVLL